jgi:hypothetical protein
MWETSGFDNEDLLWAGFGLFGGIAGKQQATCGAITASAVYLGLRHRLPLSDKAAVIRAKGEIEREAAGLVAEFMRRFGSMTCIELVKMDLSDPEVRKKYIDMNLSRDTCDRFVSFVIDSLYEMEEKRDKNN